jgi:hypothetical protein
VEPRDDSDDKIQKGDLSPVGDHRRWSLPPSGNTRNIEQDGSKSNPWTLVSIALIALSLLGSCCAVPFLFPFFQLYLVPPILIAIAVGWIGGWFRSWLLTGLLAFSLLSVYVAHDLVNNPFGYKEIYSQYILNNPPKGLYFHSWHQLYQITIIPLTLGVTVLTYARVAEYRRLRDKERTTQAQGATSGSGTEVSETAVFKKNEQ